jgi:carbon monoxide dehydrogenase subunit G
MEFDHGFSVHAPIDAVWATITDIERVAPCLPNTRVTGAAGPDSYDVEITAAFGPFEITATGKVTLVEHDDATRREVLKVVAHDPDDEPLADATVTIVLTQDGDTTSAAVHSSVAVGGLATLVADETLDEVAGKTLNTFAANLEALLDSDRS